MSSSSQSNRFSMPEANRKRASSSVFANPNKKPQRVASDLDKLQNNNAPIGQQPVRMSRFSTTFNERPNRLQSYLLARQTPTPKKALPDVRNNKDPETLREYMKYINDYLAQTKYNGTTIRSHRDLSLTQFTAIFKHLTHRALPKYVFDKKFEVHCLDVIKRLNYPYADTISSKNLVTVGAPHSISSFLALLSWMASNGKQIDLYAKDCEERIEDVNPINSGQLYGDYNESCYHTYMSGSDDYSVQNKKLEEIFDESNRINQEIICRLEVTNMQLEKRFDDLNNEIRPFDILHRKNKQLKEDLVVLQRYQQEKQKRIKKYTDLNALIASEIQGLEADSAVLEKENASFKAYLVSKNISEEEIDRSQEMNTKLNQDKIEWEKKLQSLRNVFTEKQSRVTKIRKELEHAIVDHNSKVHTIAPDHPQYRIQYLNTDIEQEIVPQLTLLEKEVKDFFDKASEQTPLLRDQLSTVKKALMEANTELQSVESIYHEKYAAYEEFYQKAVIDNKNYNTDMAKHDRNLKALVDEEKAKLFSAQSNIEAKKHFLASETGKSEAEENRKTDELEAGYEAVRQLVEHLEIGAEKFKEGMANLCEKYTL